MKTPHKDRKLRFSAFSISILLHLVILSTFGAVTFSKGKEAARKYVTPKVSAARVRKQLKQTPIIPKPKVKEKVVELRKEKQKEFAKKQVKLANNSVDIDLAKDISQIIETLEIEPQQVSQIEFFGSQTSMRKVCFVVDCSGSMLGLFREVRNNLKASVSELGPDNYFYVIMFHGTGLIEIGDGKLLRATPANVRRAIRKIDKCPRPFGSPKALEAIKRAIRLKDNSGETAEVIYFLTDGFDFSTDENLSFIESVEKERLTFSPNTRIHSIGFWTNSTDRKMLEKMAKASGGEFINFTGKVQ